MRGEKHPLKGGLCIEHGGQRSKKPCEVEGCWQLAYKGVYCCKHGEILLQRGGVRSTSERRVAQSTCPSSRIGLKSDENEE